MTVPGAPQDGLDGIRALRRVDDSLVTAGQPTEAQLEAVSRAGFEVVVNLALHDNPRYSLPDEPGLVASLGMEYVHIPVDFERPRHADLVRFCDAMAAHAGRRRFVHCAANMRVTAFLGLYRVLRLGWPREAAFALMHDVWQPDATWAAFIEEELRRPGPPVALRPLVRDDATAYRALMLEAYTAHPDAFGSTAEERAELPLSWWEERLGAAPGADVVVIGAFLGADLVGAAGVRFESRPKRAHHATIFGMSVRPEARGRGVGRSLVGAALRVASARPGCRVVQLSVTEVNAAARRLYEACGFAAWGVEPMALSVGGDLVGMVHMWRRTDPSP